MENTDDRDFTGRIFDYYGLKQDDLSTYIGMSRSTVSMLNIFKRELPPGKFLKLARLDPQFARPLPPDTQGQIAMETQNQTGELQRDDRARLRALKVRTAKGTKQLEAMKKKESQAINSLGFVANELPGAEAGDLSFLERIRAEAWVKFRENGPGPQAKLVRRLALWAFEKSLIEQGAAPSAD